MPSGALRGLNRRAVGQVCWLLVIVSVAVLPACQGASGPELGTVGPRYTVHGEEYASDIERAVDYLSRRYNPDVGLIPEARPPGGWQIDGRFWTMDKVYWLADNRLAAMALTPYDPNLAARIQQKVHTFAPYDSDPKSDLFAGHRIPAKDWGRQRAPVEETNDFIVVGAKNADYTLDPFSDYADITIMYSLQAWRSGFRTCARNLLRQVIETWDGRGLVDGPARQARSYAMYKLGMLLTALQVIDVPFPQAKQAEKIMWDAQDASGGIVTGLSFRGKYGAGPNTETTALVLLPYDQNRIAMLRHLLPPDERQEPIECQKDGNSNQ